MLKKKLLPKVPLRKTNTKSSVQSETISHFCSTFNKHSGLSQMLIIPTDSPWKVHLSNLDPKMTGVTVSGLTPARTYQFRVCAVNQVGKGQYSAETSRYSKNTFLCTPHKKKNADCCE